MKTSNLARRAASTARTTSVLKTATALPFHCLPCPTVDTTRRSLSVSREAIKAASEWKKSGNKEVGVYSQTESEYTLGKHRSNALSLLQQQDVIEVDGDMAVCDGGGGSMGHPLEYIMLGARQDIGEGSWADGIRCLYCGLRYRSKPH